MKKYRYYLPLQFLLFLLLGIVVQNYTQIWVVNAVFHLSFFAVLLLLFAAANHKYRIFIAWVIFLGIGMLRMYESVELHHPNHFSKRISESGPLVFKITKQLNSGNKVFRYEAEVLRMHDQKAKGKLLVSLNKSATQPFTIDDIIVSPKMPEPVLPPLNPHQFDYRSYLTSHQIYHQLYLTADDFISIQTGRTSLYGWADDLRTIVQGGIERQGFSKATSGMLQALLLGQRQELSEAVVEDYKKAGAIHILAISGLHVGILLILLNLLTKPLIAMGFGPKFKFILILVCLWTFALIAGLSPSIVRAVTMFSFFAFGQFLNRKGSVYHSIISSMLLLLMVHPLYVFDVGFQLSYLAVFGIVWLQPKLEKLWRPKYGIINYFWKLLTVSLAAQLLVLPISLYYFHQFPALFWLTNLLVIPFLGVLLLFGILIVGLSVYMTLPKVVVSFFDAMIALINWVVGTIARVEFAVFTDLFISEIGLVLLYTSIFGLIFLFTQKRFPYVFVVLIGVIGLQTERIVENARRNETRQWILFHQSRQTLIGLRRGPDIQLFSEAKDRVAHRKFLTNYLGKERLTVSATDTVPSLFQFGSELILVVDETEIYELEQLSQPIVLLRNSPKINIERLICKLQPKQLLADGSNYPSHVANWKKAALANKIPFHFTGREGAYILK